MRDELLDDSFIFETTKSYKLTLESNDIDFLIPIYEKLYWAYLNLLNRCRKLNKCRRRIFAVKLFLWRIHFERSIRYIINYMCDKAKLQNITEYIENYLIENNFADPKLVKFFSCLHNNITIPYINFLNSIITSNDNPKNKISNLIKEFLELLNITLLELEGLNISCDVLYEKDEERDINCNECDNIDNVIILHIVPEYFVFNTFDNLINSFDKIKKKDDVLCIINLKMLCRETDIVYDEKTIINKCLELKNFIHDIYFINQSCISEDISHLNAIQNQQHLYRIIDEWREKKGKQKKYILDN